MKKRALGSLSLFLFFLHSSSSFAQVSWGKIISDSGVEINVDNKSDQIQVCTFPLSVSLLDSERFTKGEKYFEFRDYIIQPRMIQSFRIEKNNIALSGELSLGELLIDYTDKAKCRELKLQFSEIRKSVEGALRNSDVDSALLFMQYADEPKRIKVVDASHSNFNSMDAKKILHLNFIDSFKSTLDQNNPNDDAQECKIRKSVKCGFKYFETDSTACEPLRFNERRHPLCHCKTRSRDFWKNGKCKTWNTCRRSEFGVEKYKVCEHESHGIEDAKECLLKKNATGDLVPCSL